MWALFFNRDLCVMGVCWHLLGADFSLSCFGEFLIVFFSHLWAQSFYLVIKWHWNDSTLLGTFVKQPELQIARLHWSL